MTSANNRQLTPDAMLLLADRLADTMGKIERWAGISISGSSRVAEAVRVLQSVTASGAFPESRADLALVAHAVRDAQNFWVISNMLGPERLPPVVRALRDAIGGDLGVTPHRAYQAQSELWAGALIAATGTSVSVMPDADEKKPDFVLTNGTWNTQWKSSGHRPFAAHANSSRRRPDNSCPPDFTAERWLLI